MATAQSSRDELAALNDARLGELIRADEGAAEHEIERLLAESQPVIDGILARYTRTRTLISAEDAEDVHATIQFRLVVKLRAIATGPEEAIRNLRGYVATLAYNVINDHLRKRFPERARLKARLRYALTHGGGMAMWQTDAGLVCGLAAWEGSEDAANLPSPIPPLDGCEAAEALERIFRATNAPMLFEDAVDVIADAWNVADVEPAPLYAVAELADPSTSVEDLDFARALWMEIRELPPMQRKALLLNLRYGGESNIISLLILGRIARFDEIAEALEMSRAELTSIWRALPIDDATLAERFGITRQQIINLRKSARARLSRRMGR